MLYITDGKTLVHTTHKSWHNKIQLVFELKHKNTHTCIWLVDALINLHNTYEQTVTYNVPRLRSPINSSDLAILNSCQVLLSIQVVLVSCAMTL